MAAEHWLLAQRGIHDTLRLPKTEKAAKQLKDETTKRIDSFSTKAIELAKSRTSDERKAMELAHLLEFWMLRGRTA